MTGSLPLPTPAALFPHSLPLRGSSEVRHDRCPVGARYDDVCVAVRFG